METGFRRGRAAWAGAACSSSSHRSIIYPSYIPFNIASGGNLKSWDNFKYAWDNPAAMYHPHSNLEAKHPVGSPVTVAFMIKPMWFYKADNLASRAGWAPSPRSATPAYGGWPRRRSVALRARLPEPQAPAAEVFLLVAILAAFLPWVLVSA